MPNKNLNINGETYTQDTEPTRLLFLLLKHLDSRTEFSPVQLSDSEILILKSWLIDQADRMEPGQTALIQKASSTDPQTFVLEAAVGKHSDGTTFLWHEPLPWPPGAH